MDGNDKVAAFVREMSWEAAPEAARARTLDCLLDDLGATIVGTLARSSRISAEYAAESWCGSEATVLLHDLRANAAGAAFANATAANALDIDDDEVFCRAHPGAQLFPTALAVAEKLGATGKAMLEALLVGYEVAPRVGYCWHDHNEPLYRGCGSWGSLACAAVAARLLGLEHDQIKHALGIAEYFSPHVPMMRDVHSPVMLKHAIGWGAMTGVISAELAHRGFTGIPSLLGFPKYEDFVSRIGEDYLIIDGVFHKRWMSCAWGHPACVAALEVVRESSLDVDGITKITVRTFNEAYDLYQGYPTTTEEAQFSVMWPLACLLLDGELGPDQMLEKRFEDERVRSLVDRIELVIDPEVVELYQPSKNIMMSRVEITTVDGRHLDSGMVGREAEGWDSAALEAKFLHVAAYVVGHSRAESLVQTVREFEKIDDVRDFARSLA